MKTVNQRQLPKPIFIVMTAYDNEFLEKELMRNGAAYCVLKPFETVSYTHLDVYKRQVL